MKTVIVTLITFYQHFLSFDTGMLAVFAPGGACKFNPTCSEYTKQMVTEHGVAKGLVMGAKRIWSCR